MLNIASTSGQFCEYINILSISFLIVSSRIKGETGNFGYFQCPVNLCPLHYFYQHLGICVRFESLIKLLRGNKVEVKWRLIFIDIDGNIEMGSSVDFDIDC